MVYIIAIGAGFLFFKDRSGAGVLASLPIAVGLFHAAFSALIAW